MICHVGAYGSADIKKVRLARAHPGQAWTPVPDLLALCARRQALFRLCRHASPISRCRHMLDPYPAFCRCFANVLVHQPSKGVLAALPGQRLIQAHHLIEARSVSWAGAASLTSCSTGPSRGACCTPWAAARPACAGLRARHWRPGPCCTSSRTPCPRARCIRGSAGAPPLERCRCLQMHVHTPAHARVKLGRTCIRGSAGLASMPIAAGQQENVSCAWAWQGGKKNIEGMCQNKA